MKTLKLSNEVIKNYLNKKDINKNIDDDSLLELLDSLSPESTNRDGIKTIVYLDYDELMEIIENSEYAKISYNMVYNSTTINDTKNIKEIQDISNENEGLIGMIAVFNIHEETSLFSIGDMVEKLETDIIFCVNGNNNLKIDEIEMALISFYKNDSIIEK